MNLRSLAIWGVIVLILVALYGMMSRGSAQPGSEITYSQMLERIDGGQVTAAEVGVDSVTVQGEGEQRFTAVTPTSQEELLRRLDANNVETRIRPNRPNTWLNLLGSLLPILLLVGVWIFVMRQMQGGAR